MKLDQQQVSVWLNQDIFCTTICNRDCEHSVLLRSHKRLLLPYSPSNHPCHKSSQWHSRQSQSRVCMINDITVWLTAFQIPAWRSWDSWVHLLDCDSSSEHSSARSVLHPNIHQSSAQPVLPRVGILASPGIFLSLQRSDLFWPCSLGSSSLTWNCFVTCGFVMMYYFAYNIMDETFSAVQICRLRRGFSITVFFMDLTGVN